MKIEEEIRLFSEDKDIITISQGPQFKQGERYIEAMIAFGLLISSIANIVNGHYIIFLILFIISFVIFFYALDIHGLQYDRVKRKIRDYKNFLWFKIGDWDDIDDYKTISVTKKNIVLPGDEDAGYSSETHHYYHIKLQNDTNKKEIFLSEYKNYYKALNIATMISKSTGLELRNIYQSKK